MVGGGAGDDTLKRGSALILRGVFFTVEGSERHGGLDSESLLGVDVERVWLKSLGWFHMILLIL
jgi:hypothetical protein